MQTAPGTTHRTPAVPLALVLGSALMAGLSGCAGGEVVTPEALRAARAKWDKAGVRDYVLEWSKSGPSNGRYVVTVRDAQVTSVVSVSPDGRRGVVRPAEPKYYGVEGLFLTIADEFAVAEGPSPFGQPRGTKVVLRFTPDPVYGYPRSYRRDVLGAPTALAIDVLRFEPGAAAPHDPVNP